jgi:small-conductance mechanosensitive channel
MTSAAVTPSREFLWKPGLRLIRMTWRMLPHLAFAAIALAGAWLLEVGAERRHQVLVACGFLAGWSFLRALATELLSPHRPGLRVLPLDDVDATRASAAVRILLGILLVTELGRWLLERNGAAPALGATLTIVRNGSLVLFGAALLAASGLPRRLREVAGGGLLGIAAGVVTRGLLPLLVPAGLGFAIAYGLGYVPLANWIATNLGWTLLQVLLASVVHRWLRDGLRDALSLGRGGAGTEDHPPSPATVGVERMGSGLLTLLIAGGTTLWVLATWGFPPSRIAEGLGRPLFEGAALTWGRMLGGFGKVFGVVLTWRVLKTVLTFFAFPAANLDVGARYAILAVLRYVVIGLTILFLLDALGIDTGSLAWFFGAAGIGIGLGLQDVIANFFSGLLMLLERPVRVGDVVAVGATTGTVEAIQMRGTLIRTPQNTTVLVPNRQMMSERLANLSYGMAHSVVEVPVSVAPAADPEVVSRVLLDAASRHPDVVLVPPPVVRLSALGPLSLDFVLLAHTARVRERLAVASDLRFRIMAAFRREGIDLPSASVVRPPLREDL